MDRSVMSPNGKSEEARRHFAEILEGKRSREREREALRDHPIHLELEDALRSAAVEAHGKKAKKWNLAKIGGMLPEEVLTRVRKPFADRFDVMMDTIRKAIDAHEETLRELAEDAAIHPGPPREFYVARPSDWHTQGFGAPRYAEGAAEARADIARLHGVGVMVAHTGKTTHGGAPYYPMISDERFTVLVKVEDALDLEILRRRPGPDLREWVRLCWKRGVNPRVYNPWLPPGYEEKVGLDYFGGEVLK